MTDNNEKLRIPIGVPVDLIAYFDEDADKLQYFLADTITTIQETMNITLTVYLRTHCKQCLLPEVLDHALSWMQTEGYKHITEAKDPDQYLRQVVIVVQKHVTELMDQHCSQEPANDTLH